MSLINQWNKKITTLLSARGEALHTARTRLRIIQSISLILFALIIFRLGDWTLLQNVQEPTIDNPQTVDIHRADIIDRNGVLLATTLQAPSLYADPTLITNKPFIANQLETILNISNVLPKLERKGRFVWIKRGLTPEEHYAINAIGSPGLGFKMEKRRFYPQGKLASHLVGYSSIDGKGLAGIELYYNDRLSTNSAPLSLNMDIRIQHALHKALQSTMADFKAKAAIGGVIDIQNGDVIAAVSLPDFDPHTANTATNDEKFNRFATGVYEMGSTFKTFSTANYIEQTDNPFSTTFDAREPLKEGRFTINDYHAEKRVLTLPEVFIHSSNIGTALMAKVSGTESTKKFYDKLGLMTPVQSDFPALAKPLTPNPWRDINTLTASYGHGIAVTPLHVLQAMATIANQGVRPNMTFAKEADQTQTEIQERILSAASAYKMRQLLRLNVTDGSGQKADVDGYYVGGKTGTSEKVSPNGGYDASRLLSSFIAIFPSYEPRYAVLAMLDEPQGNKKSYGYATAGWTAAPAVGQTISDMARILAIPHDKNPPQITNGLDRYLTKETTIHSASF